MQASAIKSPLTMGTSSIKQFKKFSIKEGSGEIHKICCKLLKVAGRVLTLLALGSLIGLNTLPLAINFPLAMCAIAVIFFEMTQEHENKKMQQTFDIQLWECRVALEDSIKTKNASKACQAFKNYKILKDQQRQNKTAEIQDKFHSSKITSQEVKKYQHLEDSIMKRGQRLEQAINDRSQWFIISNYYYKYEKACERHFRFLSHLKNNWHHSHILSI